MLMLAQGATLFFSVFTFSPKPVQFCLDENLQKMTHSIFGEISCVWEHHG